MMCVCRGRTEPLTRPPPGLSQGRDRRVAACTHPHSFRFGVRINHPRNTSLAPLQPSSLSRCTRSSRADNSRCFRKQRPNTHNKFHRPPIHPSPCPVRLSSYFFNIAVCMYVNQPFGWFGVNRLHHCGMAAICPRLLCFRRIGNAISGMCVYVCASDSHAVTVLCFPLPPKNSPRKRRNVRKVSA